MYLSHFLVVLTLSLFLVLLTNWLLGLKPHILFQMIASTWIESLQWITAKKPHSPKSGRYLAFAHTFSIESCPRTLGSQQSSITANQTFLMPTRWLPGCISMHRLVTRHVCVHTVPICWDTQKASRLLQQSSDLGVTWQLGANPNTIVY